MHKRGPIKEGGQRGKIKKTNGFSESNEFNGLNGINEINAIRSEDCAS